MCQLENFVHLLFKKFEGREWKKNFLLYFWQEKFTPVKYFSIDRVFRNETTDATHLAEFHQIEGVVADYGLTLGNLMGIIQEFFRKLNITKLRFKPTYNPYTEPSMEVFSYHEGLYHRYFGHKWSK